MFCPMCRMNTEEEEFLSLGLIENIGRYESISAYKEGFLLCTFRANPVKFQFMREPAKASLLHQPVL